MHDSLTPVRFLYVKPRRRHSRHWRMARAACIALTFALPFLLLLAARQ